MTPSKWIQNSLSHLDDASPLLISNSTDCHPSTSKNSGFVPNSLQHLNCVKTLIKPDQDMTIKNECISTYAWDYPEKHPQENFRGNELAQSYLKINYIQPEQDRVFKNLPPLRTVQISEMKESYL